MLAESIVEIGRPIVSSDRLPNEQRIRLLTDVDEENCKNFYQHIFVIEIDGEHSAFHFLSMTGTERAGLRENSAFPVFYPNGGNPIVAQGIYPLPCYLVYEKHIKKMNQPDEFASKTILPRLKKTVPYKNTDEEELSRIAVLAAQQLQKHYNEFISEEKQLGILYIVDHRLPVFHTTNELKKSKRFFWIDRSFLLKDSYLYLDSELALSSIVESRFMEAKTLGYEKNAVSTFTNKTESEVVSIYNKSWLWLSPTWELPRSIYWGKEEWTKGIKIDKRNYEAFLYGAQFLKHITVPIKAGLLKELFAPVTNAEAKKNMKPTSFEPVFGVPLVLPLLKGDSEQLYEKYRRILKNEKGSDDLQLEIIAGIDRMVPKMSNSHRLALLYYSGDLSRGDMHIRMMISDVIPSVASAVQKILLSINRKDLLDIRHFLNIPSSIDRQNYRVKTLPSLLSNAYGPGYLWSAFQSVLHKENIGLERLYRSTSAKLTELANKEKHWEMVDELTFYLMFLAFKRDYDIHLLNKGGVDILSRWNDLKGKYSEGTVTIADLESTEALGYVTGLLLKQFSNSYQRKTGKDFVKHRVMKFGSKLTPLLVWKNGVLRCEELKEQWDMGLAGNFYPSLGSVLAALIDADKKGSLSKEKDIFMTAFWSGYLTYRKSERQSDENDLMENKGETVSD